MICPACNHKEFQRKELEGGLQALECNNCKGHWISSFNYWLWADKLTETLPEQPNPHHLTPHEHKGSKVCPECTKLLHKYAVGHHTDFSIDRCEKCRGIWFDANEWEILREMNLHDEIHKIFSTHWQKAVQEERTEDHRAHILKEKVGEEDFLRIHECKEWILNHPEKSMLLAYLNQIR